MIVYVLVWSSEQGELHAEVFDDYAEAVEFRTDFITSEHAPITAHKV